MLCEACQQVEATVRLTEVTDGRKEDHHLCEQCAAAKDNVAPTLKANEKADVQSLLEGLVEIKLGAGGEGTQACPSCGITFGQFRRQGRLGCPNDYDIFRDELNALLERIHGGKTHIGKHPGEASPEMALERRRHQLREELDQAIVREAYEDAASIRDQLREIEGEIDGA